MKSKIKIGGLQFFCLIFLFELGSAVLFGMAKEAKQDAWIPILLGIAGGCILFSVYLGLHKRYPDLPLTSYSQQILGKYLGWVIGFGYVVYFSYLAARVLRDFEELLVISQYHNTSLLTLGLYMIASIIYVMFKGFEVFSRLSQICLFLFLFTALPILLLEVSAQLLQPENLLPLLENGWSPVIKALFPSTISVPFGEMVAFTMLLPLVKDYKTAKRFGYLGIIVSGLYLTFRTLMNIAAIGTDARMRSTFPVLTEIGLVEIGDFIQRLDSLILIILVILGFVKIFIFFYCAVLGLGDLFKLKKPDKMIYPLGILIIFTSVFIAPNFNTHLEIGFKIVPIYLHLPFQMAIPIILLLVALIKSKIKKSRTKQPN
ncbi:spore germination protein KB [Peribacillus deserti]|uniref:Spore germination protein KB n=1 Tax=Peribacillus deserti TaxID=673318 RepID=A0ABS2QKR0_9BACI|nr:GerAB/ArcD/ProY family transporter [Peribacillus deserti]MBM7693702.1 spore germination protein KB [Peribacillus deserti]